MRKIFRFILECFTDVKGRPEPKMILGVPLIIYSVVYLVTNKDLQGAMYIGGLGVTLVTGTAILDGVNDVKVSDGHKIPPGE